MFITYIYQSYCCLPISLLHVHLLSSYNLSSSYPASRSYISFLLPSSPHLFSTVLFSPLFLLSSSHLFFYCPLLTSFSTVLFSPLFLTTFSTSTDSSKGDEVTDLYLVHSNMAILNLVSQVRYTLPQCHVLCSSIPLSI